MGKHTIQRRKGIHNSPENEFKTGERNSIATEFKKGSVPKNKGTGRKVYCKECGIQINVRRKFCSFECYNKNIEVRESKREKLKGFSAKKLSENELTRSMEMSRKKYRQFRSDILERDLWTCQTCNTTKAPFQMHHIKGWFEYSELRYDPDNCITLCVKCHTLTDNYGRSVNGCE